MAEIKEMPFDEKYAKVSGFIEHDMEVFPAFIKKYIGDAAQIELQEVWQRGIESIPDNASFEVKYETAFSNLMWITRNAYELIRGYKGESLFKQLEDMQVAALKGKSKSSILYLLKLIRAISPARAFSMTVKPIMYNLQWTTPYSVSLMTKDRILIEIPDCKVLNTLRTDDMCVHGCRGSIARWVAEQYKVNMIFEREGESCTCELTPFK